MKPSWTDITAFGLLLFFALVMANGWPEGNWAFDWSALGAVGTIVIGVFAGRISYVQLQNSRLAALERKEFAKNLVLGKVVKVERSLMKLAKLVEKNVRSVTESTSDHLALDVSAVMEVLEDDNYWPDLEIPSDRQMDVTSYDLQLLEWLKECLIELRTLEEAVWLKKSTLPPPEELCKAFLKLINKAKLVAEKLEGFERGGRHLDSLTTAFDVSISFIHESPYKHVVTASAMR